MRGWKYAAVRFYWYILQSHFAFSLFAAVVTDFLPIYAWNSTSSCSFSFFPPSFSPPPSFRFSPSVNARFLLFIRASSKLLSEWLRRVVTRLTHVHSFLFFALISQFLRESGWISIIINLYNSKGNLSKFSSCSY